MTEALPEAMSIETHQRVAYHLSKVSVIFQEQVSLVGRLLFIVPPPKKGTYILRERNFERPNYVQETLITAPLQIRSSGQEVKKIKKRKYQWAIQRALSN